MTEGLRVDLKADEVLRRIEMLKRTVNDIGPHLEAVGDQIANDVRMTFVTSRDPYGRPWRPLKMRAGQPLRDTGRLMNSITYRVSGDSLEVGTNVGYAATHQFGATITPRRARFLLFKTESGKWIRAKKSKVPARPFLPTEGMPPEMERSVLDVLADSIQKKAGL